jgi:hypothetical protein
MTLFKRISEKIRSLFKFYDLITPDRDEWETVEKLQNSGKFPRYLTEVFVYTIRRQYERYVWEMEHTKAVSVRLTRPLFPLQVSPSYKEITLHEVCYNQVTGKLHVLLQPHESLEDLLYLNVSITPVQHLRAGKRGS